LMDPAALSWVQVGGCLLATEDAAAAAPPTPDGGPSTEWSSVELTVRMFPGGGGGDPSEWGGGL